MMGIFIESLSRLVTDGIGKKTRAILVKGVGGTIGVVYDYLLANTASGGHALTGRLGVRAAIFKLSVFRFDGASRLTPRTVRAE